MGRGLLWRKCTSDKVSEEENEELWASANNQWSSGSNTIFFRQTTIYCKSSCTVHLFHAFFLRCENRSMKSEMIKQSHLAAKIKEELFELKSNQQHKSNLRTQILVHDSFNILKTTPMPSPTSFSQEREERKCNWCQIPFNCFDTRNKRLKHVRNCNKSRGQWWGGEVVTDIDDY